MARYFKIPFASTGDKVVIPDATQTDGSVSFTQGFGFDYERPNTDPAYKPVPREGTNGILHDVTEAVGVIQRQGVADWTIDAQPYPINAQVYHDGKQWLALRANSVEPTEGADWSGIGTANQLATKANTSTQVIAGTGLSGGGTLDANRTLSISASYTPLGVGQTWQDVVASRAFGTTYTNTTGRAIFVSVVVMEIGSNAASLNVDGILVGHINVGSSAGAIEAQLTAIVPPASEYSLIRGGTTQQIMFWCELR